MLARPSRARNRPSVRSWPGSSYARTMPLTIDDLTRLPGLGLRLRAGDAARGRRVGWAHICELPDPGEWLTGGELVLTTGLGLGDDPAGQAAYVERLAAAGIAGLVVSRGPDTPALTDAMLAAHDAAPVALLDCPWRVPFIAVTRAVADAGDGERERLARAMRVYEGARHAASLGITGPRLLASLGSIARAGLWVLDPARGQDLLPDPGRPVPADVAAALRGAAGERAGALPAVLRLGDAGAVVVPVPASRPAALVARREGGEPDVLALQHVAALVAVELERLAGDRERARQVGAELLAGLLDGRLEGAVAARLLAAQGLGSAPLVLGVARRPAGEVAHADLHHRLAPHRVTCLLLHRRPLLFALAPDEPAALAALRAELDPAAALGLSAPLAQLARAGDAAREAQLALAGARPGGQARYGDAAAASPLVPASLPAAQALVDRVLRPLAEHDAARDSDLVGTLRAFLECNRSWQRTAAALHVHKQTLVYRVRKIEALTERRLDETDDVVELWLALRAQEVLAVG